MDSGLVQQIDKIENRLGKLEVLEDSGGGGGWTAVDASTTVKGITKLSVAPASPTNPIALGANDPSVTNSRTPTGAAGGALTGTYPNPTLAAVTTGTTLTGVGQLTFNNAGQITSYVSGSGTGFPGSPATGQKFFRTDRGIEYYYDGTRWLSVTKYIATIPFLPGIASNGFTVNTNNVWFDSHPDAATDIYIESLKTIVIIGSPNNATNYWTATYKFRNAAAATTSTATVNTSTFTALVLTPLVLLTNTVISATNFVDILVDVAKGGTGAAPGTLFVDPLRMIYRLIG